MSEIDGLDLYFLAIAEQKRLARQRADLVEARRRLCKHRLELEETSKALRRSCKATRAQANELLNMPLDRTQDQVPATLSAATFGRTGHLLAAYDQSGRLNGEKAARRKP